MIEAKPAKPTRPVQKPELIKPGIKTDDADVPLVDLPQIGYSGITNPVYPGIRPKAKIIRDPVEPTEIPAIQPNIQEIDK